MRLHERALQVTVLERCTDTTKQLRCCAHENGRDIREQCLVAREPLERHVRIEYALAAGCNTFFTSFLLARTQRQHIRRARLQLGKIKWLVQKILDAIPKRM